MNEWKVPVLGYFALLSLPLLALTIGCGNGEQQENCVADTVQECPCPDGSEGDQTCLEGGNFDTCQCSGDLDAGYSDAEEDTGESDGGEPDDVNECEPNDCGGCDVLDSEPGEACEVDGTSGQFECQSQENVICVTDGNNACGGTSTLDAAPATACGSCDQGIWTCDGTDDIRCEDEDAGINSCGGCATLDGEPGQTCGDCGVWACQGEDAMSCEGELDLQTDPDNCGSCSNQCSIYENCEAGSCEIDEVIQVVTGNMFTCALRESGEVFCWGGNDGLFAGVINDATAITAGWSHACALRESGQVLCWGDNSSGKLGNDSTGGASATPVIVETLDDVTAISAGLLHTCAVQGGQTYCWGSNAEGQLGDGTNDDSPTPVPVSDELPASVTDISTSNVHTCAVANSEAYCWGQGEYGRLGHASDADSTIPVQVIGLPSTRSITAGSQHSCALTDGEFAYCWGRNTWGQLGIGSFSAGSNTAAEVINLSTIQSLTAGLSNTTCAVRTDGRSYCWGQNQFGQVGIGSDDDQNLPQWVSTLGDDASDMAFGNNHGCALLTNGQVACWGRNGAKRLGDNQLGSDGFDRWLPVISPNIPPVTSEYGQCFTDSDSSGNGLADCDDPDCATDLGAATGDDVVSGQLLGFAGHYTQGTCGGNGPEHVFTWTAPSTGTFLFDTGSENDTDFDIVLYLRGSCIADEISCAADGRPSLEADVTEGDTYYLIVDSDASGWSNPFSGRDGVYTVNIYPGD